MLFYFCLGIFLGASTLFIFAIWFTSTPVGPNKLGNVVSKMCKDADLQGQFSNHSLRATTAIRGLEKGISDKLIMERMDHRDIRSLQRYERSDVSTKIEIYKAQNCRSEVKRFCQDDNNETVKGQCCVPELIVCNIQSLKMFLE